MCTVISYKNSSHYFGRNLDLEHSFSETVTVTPRHFKFNFHFNGSIDAHFAMIGMATVANGYPLYYDATNEFGLSIAALNFPDNAVYFPPNTNKLNLAPYELIPWILSKYKTVADIANDLVFVNLVSIPFSDQLPLSPLHWMVSDKGESIVLESTKGGLQIYKNPVNVLTNNPPFPYHIQNLSNYLQLSNDEPKNRFAPGLKLPVYSRGMGGIGLPGDLSSASRFVKAAFTLHNSVASDTEESNVNQFFHILDAVSQQRGCVRVGEQYEKTIYSCCCNTQKCIYYYKTYDNSQLTAVDMFRCDLEGKGIVTFPLRTSMSVQFEN